MIGVASLVAPVELFFCDLEIAFELGMMPCPDQDAILYFAFDDIVESFSHGARVHFHMDRTRVGVKRCLLQFEAIRSRIDCALQRPAIPFQFESNSMPV